MGRMIRGPLTKRTGSAPRRLTLVLGAALWSGAAAAHAAPGFSREPATAAPSNDWTMRSAIGLDLGAGGTITDFNRYPGPDGALFFTSIRGTVDIQRGFAAMLTLHQWWLPGPNHALLFGLGTRYEPIVAKWGLAFADLALGPASTGYAWCFGFDVGIGAEFNIPDVPGFSIGPYFRYGDFINPDRNTSRDGLAWSMGASFTYHFGRAAEGAAAPAAPTVRRGIWHISIPDTDHDGVADDEDQCPKAAAGRHPDPFRPGCPENDEDADGVPDVDDACPVTPPGDHPDPKRPGCPYIDTDGDNISDADDACPTKAGPPSTDPSRNGCPDKSQRAAPAAPPPPSAKDENLAPKPVHKRRSK
jgi:hypothetical protein